jgi:hypothetical protein
MTRTCLTGPLTRGFLLQFQPNLFHLTISRSKRLPQAIKACNTFISSRLSNICKFRLRETARNFPIGIRSPNSCLQDLWKAQMATKDFKEFINYHLITPLLEFITFNTCRDPNKSPRLIALQTSLETALAIINMI